MSQVSYGTIKYFFAPRLISAILVLRRFQRQQLCDALSAYFERLTQMGIRLPDVHRSGKQWTDAQAAVEIDEKYGNIQFFHYVAETDEFKQDSISTSTKNTDEVFEYKSNDGTCFRTLFEILTYISDEISLVAKLSHLYYEQKTH